MSNTRSDMDQGQGTSALARAVSLHLEGKSREALRELDHAVDGGNSDKEVYSARGHIQFELEMYEDAARSYESLLMLEPGSVSASFNLAVCQEKLGRWVEAAENFSRVLQADGSRMDARLGLGICLLHQKNAQPALEAFEACLGKTPSDETPMFGKAVALELLERYDEALQLTARFWPAMPTPKSPCRT